MTTERCPRCDQPKGDQERADDLPIVRKWLKERSEVRDMLRPIDASLWRAANESLAREAVEDEERAAVAKIAVALVDGGG